MNFLLYFLESKNKAHLYAFIILTNLLPRLGTMVVCLSRYFTYLAIVIYFLSSLCIIIFEIFFYRIIVQKKLNINLIFIYHVIESLIIGLTNVILVNTISSDSERTGVISLALSLANVKGIVFSYLHFESVVSQSHSFPEYTCFCSDLNNMFLVVITGVIGTFLPLYGSLAVTGVKMLFWYPVDRLSFIDTVISILIYIGMSCGIGFYEGWVIAFLVLGFVRFVAGAILLLRLRSQKNNNPVPNALVAAGIPYPQQGIEVEGLPLHAIPVSIPDPALVPVDLPYAVPIHLVPQAPGYYAVPMGEVVGQVVVGQVVVIGEVVGEAVGGEALIGEDPAGGEDPIGDMIAEDEGLVVEDPGIVEEAQALVPGIVEEAQALVPGVAEGVGAEGVGAEGVGAEGVGAEGVGAEGIGAEGIGAAGVGAVPAPQELQ